MKLSIKQSRLSGIRLFTATIRDLTVVVERDRRRRELQAELIRTARIGELDHLASTLVHHVIEPLAEVHDDLGHEQGSCGDRARREPRLLTDRLSEIATARQR